MGLCALEHSEGFSYDLVVGRAKHTQRKEVWKKITVSLLF